MQNLTSVIRIFGMLVTVFSITLLPPIGVSLYYGDGALTAFVEAFILTTVLGAALWIPTFRAQRELRLREGCLVVVLFWLVFGLVGAIPLYLADEAWHSFTDAMYESVSGITTTGATTIIGLDALPKALLYYRMQLHWLGGMGVIVLAVAVLPMLGVGGMQLYRAETPGPMKDDKLTPRITGTARALWVVYAVVTAACALSYQLAGMNWFDAICHAFSTLSSGGFSNYDASMAHFNSPLIDSITILFMLVAGTNFALHYLAWHSGSAQIYLQDTEFRVYLGFMAILVAIVSGSLYIHGTYPDLLSALRYGAFQIISTGTCTGYTSADYTSWPGGLPVLIVMAGAFCACAGSTGGGIKMVRLTLLAKYAYREILRIVHPSAEIPVRMGGKAVPHHILAAVASFFAVYVILFLILWFVLMFMDMEPLVALSAVALSLNNSGPGLGPLIAGFATVEMAPKWVCIFAMLLGRLELFTLLAILTPAFWRR